MILIVITQRIKTAYNEKRHSLLRVLILLAILTCGHALTSSAQKDVYKFVVKDGKGKEVKLKKYKGSVLLIVNTATRCGFTPQYADLQRLYEQYHAQGFEILDFPCNQFGYQAPGDYKTIHGLCTANYGITFPQFQKVMVNGKTALPLYTYLKEKEPFKGSTRRRRWVNISTKPFGRKTRTTTKAQT